MSPRKKPNAGGKPKPARVDTGDHDCGRRHSALPPLNGPIEVFDENWRRRPCTPEDVARANPHLDLRKDES